MEKSTRLMWLKTVQITVNLFNFQAIYFHDSHEAEFFVKINCFENQTYIHHVPNKISTVNVLKNLDT